jgi:hypothetical protein
MNEKAIKTYRGATMGAVHTLLALFVFGMIANLYVEIPGSAVGPAAWSWVFSHSAVLVVHIVLGTLLVLASLASLVFAFRTHTRVAVVASGLGLVFTLLAYASGSEFVSSGQTNLSSMLMALGFLGALVSYAAGVIKLKTN